MRILQYSLEGIKTIRQINPDVGDVRELDEESMEEEREVAEETIEIKILRSMFGANTRPNLKISIYHGSIDVEELIDWINEMDKFLEYEEIYVEKKVKFVITRLKGHATLWWDSV